MCIEGVWATVRQSGSRRVKPGRRHIGLLRTANIRVRSDEYPMSKQGRRDDERGDSDEHCTTVLTAPWLCKQRQYRTVENGERLGAKVMRKRRWGGQAGLCPRGWWRDTRGRYANGAGARGQRFTCLNTQLERETHECASPEPCSGVMSLPLGSAPLHGGALLQFHRSPPSPLPEGDPSLFQTRCSHTPCLAHETNTDKNQKNKKGHTQRG